MERIIRCPQMRWWAPLAAMLVCLPLGPGSSMSFTATQRDALARLVQSDREAAKLFQKFQRLADASLDDIPHPAGQIGSAGKLACDPAKVETRLALEDMKKIAALAFADVVTTNAVYARAAKRMILDWAKTNQPSGHPIDETELEPLFVAYGLTRHAFSVEERKPVESWLRLISRRQREELRANSVTASNNWNSHRLKTVGLIAFLLEDRAMIDYAMNGFKKQIESNLRSDGSSLDFHERDALHYHCYDLEPLLTLAIAAGQRGIVLYDYQSPSGASLRKSVQFLVPYCDGSATHLEWVKSKVAFDRVRANAGEKKFQVGTPFDPRDGLRVLELASFFDRDLNPLVARLAKREGHTRFPVWQSVLNEALLP